MKKFEIRQRETGNVIESEDSIVDAINTIKDYEAEDETNGEFEEDYYEIYDTQQEKVLTNVEILSAIKK